MPTRYLQNISPRTKLGVWAWSPVIVLRVALAANYISWVYAAVIAFIVGVPVFSLTTPPGWTPIWAVILGGSAAVSAVGSITDRWQKLERWASLVLSAMIFAYVGGLNIVGYLEHDLNRQFAGAVALIAAILPLTRFVYLAAQSGKKRVNDVVGTG